MDMPQELQLSVTGRVRLELRDEHGNLKHVDEVKNLVTTAGKNHIASRIKDATATAMTHVGGWHQRHCPRCRRHHAEHRDWHARRAGQHDRVHQHRHLRVHLRRR